MLEEVGSLSHEGSRRAVKSMWWGLGGEGRLYLMTVRERGKGVSAQQCKRKESVSSVICTHASIRCRCGFSFGDLLLGVIGIALITITAVHSTCKTDLVVRIIERPFICVRS